ncbi:hypothetical protein RHMOL_Rhmol05G0089100 [Rhododendron molle]|uniref:Uncharacterized protein n=1 Tax=Rhododendron molle TaxID=49168 RepID=A0ACC0NLR2_RHOML|nr:hypothetical protein RHMOL_Rhmol05G0089100 [Rhododendron molle]
MCPSRPHGERQQMARSQNSTQKTRQNKNSADEKVNAKIGSSNNQFKDHLGSDSRTLEGSN